MNQKKQTAESKVKAIRRHTRKKYSAEEKIRIVIEGMRGESSIAELCRKEGINANLYYNWSKDFLEAGKRRLAGDTNLGMDIMANYQLFCNGIEMILRMRLRSGEMK